MPASQIIGATTSTLAEIEATTKALRGTLRPANCLGHFRVAGNSGLMAAGLAANSQLFSFRWSSLAAVAAIRRIIVTAATDTAFSATNSVNWPLVRGTSYTSNPSGGTSLTPSGNMNKLRTSMNTSLVADIRIAGTAGLTTGTVQLLNAGPQIKIFETVGAGKTFLGLFPGTGFEERYGKYHILFEARPGEYPLVLAANEGVILTSDPSTTMSNTGGIWRFSVNVLWEEYTSYYI